ncbi:hypothetical protein D3C76_1183780 [compost metagenome]
MFVTEAQFLHRTWPEILSYHIGGGQQLFDRCHALSRLHIHRKALLVAVVCHPITSAGAHQATGIIALRDRLDLDDFRAQVG